MCVCPNIYFLFTIRLFPVAAGAFSAKCFCSVHHQVRSLKLTCTTWSLVVYMFSLQTSCSHAQGLFSYFLHEPHFTAFGLRCSQTRFHTVTLVTVSTSALTASGSRGGLETFLFSLSDVFKEKWLSEKITGRIINTESRWRSTAQNITEHEWPKIFNLSGRFILVSRSQSLCDWFWFLWCHLKHFFAYFCLFVISVCFFVCVHL